MNHQLPFVSVMIICYNSARTLPRALASLASQSHQNWEALLIDDGSFDHPEQIVDRFSDPRIRYFRFPENRGRAAARQKALENMRGDFLGMLDADDWWIPDKLQRQLETLQENPDLALVSSAMFLIDKQNWLHGVARFSKKPGLTIYPALPRPHTLPLPHAPILVRTKVLQGHQYDSRLSVSEDLDFFLPILLKHPFGIVSQPLYVYAFEGNRSLGTIRAQLRAHRLIFFKYIKNYWHTALFRICMTFPKIWIATILYALPMGSWIKNRKVFLVQKSELESYQLADQEILKTLAALEPTGA